MAIRPTVFGSFNEKEMFYSIESLWQSRFSVYPQLPFCAVFELDNLSLTEKEIDFLRKSSIDYTLCTKSGKPLLSIEFDGMGHGFSRNGEYTEIHPSKAKNRKLKLDLKLKLAGIEQFPFYVVSYDEKVPISEDIHLTVVDGIIGQTLKHRDFPQIAKEWVDDEKSVLDNLSESERHERIQDIVIGAEVIAELNWDPIAKRSSDLEGDLRRKGFYKGDTSEFISDPELPDFDWNTGTGFEARIQAFKNMIRCGCRYTVHTAFGDITETAWVRNFAGSEVSPLTIAENIASLLAYNRALKLAPRPPNGNI
jgi:hypothetical protein